MVFAFFVGIVSVEGAKVSSRKPLAIQQMADIDGDMFVRYSNAISVFSAHNSTYRGDVALSQLTDLGYSFPESFIVDVGAHISDYGVSGREITVYGILPSGAITEIVKSTSGDASYGTSSGSTWKSVAIGSVSQPLAIPVQAGSVVFVVRLGS